jgi:hypothetical protein
LPLGLTHIGYLNIGYLNIGLNDQNIKLAKGSIDLGNKANERLK